MRQVDKLLAQVVQPVLGLAAGPDPRDGRQVVCAHRGNRVVWPASRLRAFEPDEAVGKRTLLLELLAHDRLDQAEVLADHKRAGPATLVGEQGQQRRSGIADVRTLRGVHTVRNPEKTEQAHHVVEADARGVAPGGADRFDERHPLRLAELPRVDRKITRLNSSHGYISYAVFCLKKKKKKKERNTVTQKKLIQQRNKKHIKKA